MLDQYTAPDHRRSALVTIDVQRDTLDGQPLEVPGTSAALPQLVRALESFRARALPVVHVVRIYRRDGSNVDLCRRALLERGAPLLLAGSAGSQLAGSLLPSPEIVLDAERLLAGELQAIGEREWIMYKPRWGALFGTPLEAHLHSLGVTTLVIAGCNFPNCPRTTIYEASERDLRLVVLADALSGLYPRGREELDRIGVWVTDTDSYLRVVEE